MEKPTHIRVTTLAGRKVAKIGSKEADKLTRAAGSAHGKIEYGKLGTAGNFVKKFDAPLSALISFPAPKKKAVK